MRKLDTKQQKMWRTERGKLTTDSIEVPLWWEPADKVTFGPEGVPMR